MDRSSRDSPSGYSNKFNIWLWWWMVIVKFCHSCCYCGIESNCALHIAILSTIFGSVFIVCMCIPSDKKCGTTGRIMMTLHFTLLRSIFTKTSFVHFLIDKIPRYLYNDIVVKKKFIIKRHLRAWDRLSICRRDRSLDYLFKVNVKSEDSVEK